MAERLFRDSVIPTRDRSISDAKYKATDKGQVSDRKYRESEAGQTAKATGRKNYRAKRTVERQADYLSRPFVAWDGEGINEPDGSHTYVLIANSRGSSLSERNGLGTSQVFDLFLSCRDDKAIHVIYGGNYDWNMILKDLDRDSLESLYANGVVWWRRYKIEWRPGKSFAVSKHGERFLMYDVIPFFQRSFVSACDEYLGTEWPFRDEIIREKANRGTFDYARIGDIEEYNRAELDTLVSLCNELRIRLHKVDIRVSRWDGPGAIASALYKKYQVKPTISPTPEPVAIAARNGYAGGRFEIIRKGHSGEPAYQYDIRSAYPSAMRNLPCLTHGEWTHRIHPNDIGDFGIYRISVTGPQVTPTRPQPFWHRNKDGTVYFSDSPSNWYWTPEARIANTMGNNAMVHEGWEYVARCECDPFSFVERLYNKRAALKKAGDGAHVGLKLGLNLQPLRKARPANRMGCRSAIAYPSVSLSRMGGVHHVSLSGASLPSCHART